MQLRLEESGEEDIFWWVFFGFGRGGRFEGGEGDLFVVLGEGICVHSAIMHDLSIKQPRAPQQDMACIHRYNVTPNVILVILTNA